MTVTPDENPYPVGPQGPLYLTGRELAERFRTAPSSIRDWRAKGDCPVGVRFGREVLYPLPEVERWEREKFEAAERENRRRANPLAEVAPPLAGQPRTTAVRSGASARSGDWNGTRSNSTRRRNSA